MSMAEGKQRRGCAKNQINCQQAQLEREGMLELNGWQVEEIGGQSIPGIEEYHRSSYDESYGEQDGSC
jgi:hypothetical protein